MMPEKALELKLLLEIMNPDQIFVEIADNDLHNYENYMTDEMLFITEWAKQNNKKIVGHGFISDCNLLLEENRNKILIEEFSHLIAGNNWKVFNKIDSEIYENFYNLCFPDNREWQKAIGRTKTKYRKCLDLGLTHCHIGRK